MTRIVHCKKESYDILIDRTTKWGNPFIIGIDGTREEVIEKHRRWFLRNKKLMKELIKLKGRVLG
jgi:hypothetical protein